MKKIIFSLGVFSLLLPTFVSASVFQHDPNLNMDQVIKENLYIAGSNTMVSGMVEGDLFVAGSTVFITGNITKDVAVAGGNVNISGAVGDDLRVFGGNVYLDGAVNGEVMVAGGDIKVGPHAVIKGNFYSSSGTITIDPLAKIMGEQHIVKDDNEGRVENDEQKPSFAVGAFIVAQIFSILSLLFVGMILFGVFKKPLQFYVDEALKKEYFWSQVGYGFLMLFVTPIVVLISWITGIGVIFGFILLFAYILYILLGIVLAGFIFGQLLKNYIQKGNTEPLNWLWVIVGIIALHIVSLVPVVGSLVSFVFFLMAMGAALRVKALFLKKM